MTDKILIERDVVDQAVHDFEAIKFRLSPSQSANLHYVTPQLIYRATISSNALNAALATAEQPQEPVAIVTMAARTVGSEVKSPALAVIGDLPPVGTKLYARPTTQPAGEPTSKDALQRLQTYLARRRKARSIDREVIHSFDIGEPSEALLLASDIEALLMQPASEPFAVPAWFAMVREWAEKWSAITYEDPYKHAANEILAMLSAQKEQPAQGELVRYCYECSSIGEVDRTKHRDCCPDGSHGMYVHPEVAKQAKAGFASLLQSTADTKQVERVPLTEAQAREIAALQADAERYRWLRDAGSQGFSNGVPQRGATIATNNAVKVHFVYWVDAQELGAMIDAARTKGIV